MRSFEDLDRYPVPSIYAPSRTTSPYAATADGTSQPQSSLRPRFHPYWLISPSPLASAPLPAASCAATAGGSQPQSTLRPRFHPYQPISPSPSASTRSSSPSASTLLYATSYAPTAGGSQPQSTLRPRFHPYQPFSSPSTPPRAASSYTAATGGSQAQSSLQPQFHPCQTVSLSSLVSERLSPLASTTLSPEDSMDVDIEESSQSSDEAQPHAANAAMRGRGRCRKRGAAAPKRKKVNKKGKKSFQLGKEPGISMSDAATSFIGVIAAARWGSESYDVESWLREICEGFAEVPSLQSNEDSESLTSLVKRCHLTQAAGLRASFFNMVSSIKLAAKCHRYILSFILFKPNFLCCSIMASTQLKTVTAIRESEFQDCSDAPKDHTFRQWYAAGCKFAAVAAGGSLYLLILIAGLSLKTKLSQMPGDTPWEIADILRAPPHSMSTQLSWI